MATATERGEREERDEPPAGWAGLPARLGPDDPFETSSFIRTRAAERPHQRAVVVPRGRGPDGRARWSHVTFARLDQEVDRTAHALAAAGVRPGDRVVLLVPPGIELITLVYGVFRAGASVVLIDPGMGARAFIACLEQVRPRGLVAVGLGHLLLHLLGRRLLAGMPVRLRAGGGLPLGTPLDDLRALAPAGPFAAPRAPASREAAVLFTSGSTGPAKGVVYRHATLFAQTRAIARAYGIVPGEVDVPGLPGFALFSVALGATVVFPDMDFSRPGRLDPARFVEAIEEHGATYSFGSPAIWGKVAAHCVARGLRLPSLRRVLMAGAPIPPALHEDLRRVLPPDADGHTPYGATEALPVASMRGRELEATFAETRAGRGTCVGRPLPGVELRVIRITDEPIAAWSDDLLVPPGALGELVVRGDVVTDAYAELPAATARAKIPDGRGGVWHRMGDLGFVDAEGRAWFCGRKSHRVDTAAGLVHSGLEALFAEHPAVARCALVGVGAAPGARRPVLIVEPRPGARPRGAAARAALEGELLALGARAPETAQVTELLLHPGLPVDVRHNAKIRRELLAEWAAGRVR